MKFSESALVLGGSPPTTLGICRNLGVNGIDVFCANEVKNEVAYSIYCKDFFVAPVIERNSEALLRLIEQIGKQVPNNKVIFAGSDLFSIAISQLAKKLPKNFLLSSSPDSLGTLIDKTQFALSLTNSSLPYPITQIPSKTSYKELACNLNYPVIIKPAIAQDFWRFNVKAILVNNSAEYIESMDRIIKYDIPVVVQELVEGPTSNLFGIAGYMDHNFELKGVFAYHRIRGWPTDFGCNSLIESIDIKKVNMTVEALRTYLKKIRYSGLFEAELKFDQRDGVAKIIEINGRSWWQNHFPTACGLNLVLMAFLDAIGRKISFSDNYKAGLKWVHSFNDVQAVVSMSNKHQLRLSELHFSYQNIVDYSYFNAKDPIPCFTNPFFVGPTYATALLRKLGILSKPVS